MPVHWTRLLNVISSTSQRIILQNFSNGAGVRYHSKNVLLGRSLTHSLILKRKRAERCALRFLGLIKLISAASKYYP